MKTAGVIGSGFGKLALAARLQSSRARTAVFEARDDRNLANMDDRSIRGLKADLVTTRIFKPVDFRDQMNAHLGSVFSLEPMSTKSVWFGASNQDEVIKNHYMVGAEKHPGMKVHEVIASAKAAASLMLNCVPGQ